MLRQCPLAIAQQLVYYANCSLSCCAEQSHKDNVVNLKDNVVNLKDNVVNLKDNVAPLL